MSTLNDFTSSFSFPLSSLVDLLRWRALQQPDRRIYTFLDDDGESEKAQLTYARLEWRARAIAAALQRIQAAGARALLIYAPGLEMEFVTAFFGCLYGGVLAVPVYAPDPARLHATLPRLLAIVKDARPSVALTTSSVQSTVDYLCSEDENFRAVRWLATDKVEDARADEWVEPELTMESLAFLQYTSGSTSAAKGVMVSHGNLLRNERGIRRVFKLTEESVGVSWLPLYHDMGLIGNVIQPLYIGFPCVLMSPLAFLQQPVRWLQAISRYRATVSGGPNFAYELCARKVTPAERDTLDLSSWQLAFNGAEPIRNETMQRFADTFKPCGFRREALYPCYGLAEAMHFVSGGLKASLPVTCSVDEAALARNRVVVTTSGDHARTIVGCGQTIIDQRIVIVNPETLQHCAADEVGEIWVSGPSVAKGYWGKDEETRHTFQAYLADTGEGPFLRTGDLGFMRDAELFITGRLKDLITIGGRNYYPQDIEWTVEQCHASVRSGCSAAFSVAAGNEERLVVVAEVERRTKPRASDTLTDFQDVAPELGRKAEAALSVPDVLAAIRGAISEHHQLQAHAVVLIKARSIPKRSSGEIHRQACKAAFLSDDLEIIGSSLSDEVSYSESTAVGAPDLLTRAELLALAPAEQPARLEAFLRQCLSELVKVPGERIGALPIAALGIDSLAAIALTNLIETRLAVALPVAAVLQGPTLAQLAALTLAQLNEGAPPAVIEPGAVNERESRLSYNQQSLWFINQLAPESAAYNLAFAARITSDLNGDALQRAFQALVDRHASLRTSYHARDGKPYQRVNENVAIGVATEDATDWSDQQLNERLAALAEQPFDLTQAPLLRINLFRRADRDHLLLLCAHHIALDLWSLVIMMEELAHLYAAAVAGTTLALPAPALQYRDFAHWQNEQLAGAAGDRHWHYWQQQLTGELPTLALPTDRPRPAVQSYRGAWHRFKLDRDRLASIKGLAQREGATLFMTLLAAYQTLLYRYSGQTDIIVGAPAAGRKQAQLADIVGYFVNPLPLRADLSGDPGFREMLSRTRATAMSAIDHQDYPFPLLVDRLRPARDAARTPIFQTLFVLERPHRLPECAPFALGAAGARLRLGALELESVAIEQRVAQFDLTLLAAEAHGELLISFQYNRDLFDADTIARLAGHFHTLLEGICDSPDMRLSQLPLLSAAEQQLLLTWNDTRVDYARERCAHQLFEAQVQRTPDAVAVQCGDEALNYRQLNARANRLARHLQMLGVDPDMPVAVCLERSVDMVVGVLAVLKAGGAFLPVDASYPRERIAFMFSDAQPAILLTTDDLFARLPDCDAHILCLDSDRDRIERQSDVNALSAARAHNLAYIIYTSGATGRPKGVMIEHRGLVNMAKAQIEAFAIDSSSRVLQFSSLSFDAAVSEIFTALLAGATLCLAAREQLLPGAPLGETLRGLAITTVTLPPTALAALPAENLPELKTVISAGEACNAEIARRWSKDRRFINAYGPTETTVCATLTEWSNEQAEELGAPPIGRPIANTRVYILDAQQQPAPIGVAGEIYIAGDGIARGYLNRPELTAQRFITDPFSNEGRLYRTGDLGRYRGDGNIAYLGRCDDQIKMRGFRIEPGEIEAVLLADSRISECTVVAREDNGEKRLVAYLAAREPVGVDELRARLQARLPEYMIPSAFVTLASLPLTPSGKIDRKALPAPDSARPDLPAAFVAPRTPAEEMLAQVWSEVLGARPIGIHDNYFALGGDSIMSIQIVSRVHQLGLGLRPEQIFQYQTIAELASVAYAARAVTAEQGAVSGDVPLTPIQHWFFEQHLTESHWNQAVMLATRGIDAAILERAVTHLMTHHDALRLRFFSDYTGTRQECAPSEENPLFTSTDLANLSPAEQREAIEAKAAQLQARLNLSDGPIARFAYFDLGADRPGRLFIVIHHLAVDSLSWRILLEDLESAYNQLSAGKTPSLPAKTTSFKYWAERLQEYAKSPAVAQERDYWLSMGRESQPLPVDHSGRENAVATAHTVSATLDSERTRVLLQEAPAVYQAHINDLLLTALMRAYRQWTGESRLLLALEGHGREEIAGDIDLTRTVGWFTAVFPIELELPAESDIGSQMKAIKEQLGRIPRRGIGYGLLRYLSDDSEMAEQLRDLPQPELSFNYLGQFEQTLAASTLFAPAPESCGRRHGLGTSRSHLIEINASVMGGCLQTDLVYSDNAHRRASVEPLLNYFLAALGEIVDHCVKSEAIGYAPADFPLARIDQAALTRLMSAHRQIEEIYPLTPLQQGLLYHTLCAPHSGVYVEQLHCRVRGRLDAAAFQRAWQRVIERHASLRAAFVWEGLDEPLQIIKRRATVPFAEEDWRALTGDALSERLSAYLSAERKRGFDLSAPPLIRLALLRTGEEEYRFVWTHHHLLTDDCSQAQIVKEVFACYEALRKGAEPQLPERGTYRDYIEWLQRQDLHAARQYWQRALAGYDAPARASESADRDLREEQWQLSAAQTAALLNFARQHELTLNTIVAGAWALLLSRYNSTRDVVFGVTVAGRPAELPRVESTVGLFINTLPLRAQFQESDTALAWLQELQSRQAEMSRYEFSPLARIQSWCGGARRLFDTLMVFENYPLDASLRETAASLEIDEISLCQQTNYPLTLAALPGAQLTLKLAYDHHRYNNATATRMLGHLKTMLAAIANHAHAPMVKLPMLTNAEQLQLLVEWNNTEADYPKAHCLHELFEDQVERTPDTVAVVYESTRLSYLELNARANRLAGYLKELGIGPDMPVAICLERSIEMVVAILATLKAGGAYVPIDPAYPAERVAFMLTDAAATVLLTQQHIAEKLPAHKAKAVCLGRDESAIAAYSVENLICAAQPDNLAYIIYTSGSTGRPKGVMISHRALCNHMYWMQEQLPLTEIDAVLQKTPFSFDASVWEFFAPLLAGAQLVMARPGGHQEIDYLIDIIDEQQITILQLLPSLLQMLTQRPSLARCTSLRRIFCGGEPFSAELVARCREKLDVQIYNLYGPAEATIDATCWQCDRTSSQVAIGRPIANTRIYILDNYLQPVPVGVAGEIYIGGDGLARGYLNRPELTAEKFIKDPFSDEEGARLYRTGDLARYWPDGNIEFLGRADQQVKLGGYRIELGEIETILNEYSGVKDSVVTVREDHGDKRLAAYLVTDNEIVIDNLRTHLKARLPDYLVPSQFVLLAELPRLSNGKIDRVALAQVTPAARADGYVAPRNEMEARLAEIWAELLGAERIGVNDNYFELGGHSLQATQLLSRIRDAFQADLPMRELFVTPTIAAVAQAIEAAGGRSASEPAPAIPRLSREAFRMKRPEKN